MTDATDPANSTSTNSDNPFAVSSLFQGGHVLGRQDVPPPSWFRVLGKLLICGPVVVLPAICAITLSEENLEPTRVLVNYPSLKIVITMRSCDVIYFRSRAVKIRRWITGTLCAFGFIGGIALLFFAAMPMDARVSALIACIGLLLILISILVLSFQSPRLRLVRYEAPGMHYIKGFSKRFLARLADHPLANSHTWNELERTS